MSFGKQKSKSSSSSTPLFSRGTQYSTVETDPSGSSNPFLKKFGLGGGRKVILDPSIRTLQQSAIDNTGQNTLGRAVGEFGASLGDLRSRLFSNLDPFIQARVSPTEERFASERGQLQRDLGRRRLTGSSFGQQALDAQSGTQARTLADQRALATQESIQAGVSIDQLVLQAKQAEAQGDLERAQLLRGIAADRAQIETALLTATTSQSSSSSSGFDIGIPSGGGGGGGGSSGL